MYNNIMLNTIEDITARIVASYDPDRVILFGSRSNGSASPESDIDLLIVKDTDERPIDRRAAVERLLLDRKVSLDLFVHTAEEVRYLFSVGSPFMQEIMETGRVLYMKKPTAAWLADAHDECETAGLLLEHDKYRASCYHSQQCVEKGLKAVIIEKNEKPERTHDIIGLLNTVKALGFDPAINSEDAVFLNSVYKGRYPTEEGLLPHGEPTRDEAAKAHGAALSFIQNLKGRL